MVNAAALLAEYVSELTTSPSPVSFYDAWEVVRRARRLPLLDARLIRLFIGLHDAPVVTFGCRQLLAEFLHTEAQRQERERTLAQRILRRADSDKVARARVGARLLLLPAVRAGCPDNWSLVAQSGPLSLQALAPAQAIHQGADFEVHLLAPGHGRLEIVEQRPAKPGKAQRFVLQVIIEDDYA